MKKFFHPIDMRCRKELVSYLEDHFRYPTMNSWNLSTSYACNLKITHLGLDSKVVDKLFDMINTQEFFDFIRPLMDNFDAEHNYRWQVGMNGRNDGYMVLYQGELQNSEYRSYCTHCGQKNYKSVLENGDKCGRCQKHCRVDYDKPPKTVVTFPGKGTDDSEDFSEWSMYELKERVRLIQELDKLADEIVQAAINIAESFTVETEEYLVPHTRRVLVEKVS